jgi:hypothetical protein
VSEVLGSREYQQDLISSYYGAYLDRAPDPTGMATFLGVLKSGGGDEAVQAGLPGSNEFTNDHSTAGFLHALYSAGRSTLLVSRHSFAPSGLTQVTRGCRRGSSARPSSSPNRAEGTKTGRGPLNAESSCWRGYHPTYSR